MFRHLQSSVVAVVLLWALIGCSRTDTDSKKAAVDPNKADANPKIAVAAPKQAEAEPKKVDVEPKKSEAAPKKAPLQVRLDGAELDEFLSELGLSESQKDQVKKLHAKYTGQFASGGIWTAYHVEDQKLQKQLTDEQDKKRRPVLNELMDSEVERMAVKLSLTAAQKEKIAKIRRDDEPKYHDLITDTQEGKKLTDKEREDTHEQVQDMRRNFHKDVLAVLDGPQRLKLTVYLKEEPGLPGMIPEEPSLALVLLGAGMAHFAQPTYKDAMADKLNLTPAQRQVFREVGNGLQAKLNQTAEQFQALMSEERGAMMAVLTDAQRAKWSELVNAKAAKSGASKSAAPKSDAPKSSSRRLDGFESLLASLGLDDKQMAVCSGIHAEFKKTVGPATTKLWNEFHAEQFALEAKLTDKQRAELPAIVKAARNQELETLAAKLGLDDAEKRRVAKVRDDYEPKHGVLVAPTLKQEKVSPEEWLETHNKILNLRLAFLAAVGAEMDESQRARLPGVLRKRPGLPQFVNDDAALAFLLLAAGLGQFAQPEYLDATASKLDLTADQRKDFQRIDAEYEPKLQTLGAQLADLLRA